VWLRLWVEFNSVYRVNVEAVQDVS
jgi:hypothetical protein